uniref:Uncharacterized protein n=1 Tax=Anguilla anguilla TaxID=7936 RepID=A0A0E9Q3H3_ANGAN
MSSTSPVRLTQFISYLSLPDPTYIVFVFIFIHDCHLNTVVLPLSVSIHLTSS